MYEEFINQLLMYVKAVRILSKGYLTISLLPPLELHEIFGEVIRVIYKTYPGSHIVIKSLHLHYDIKLVTF